MRNLTSGLVSHQLTARHRVVEFKKFLDLLEQTIAAELSVHVVLDNSSTMRPGHPTRAGPPSPFRVPPHADLVKLDESGRTVGPQAGRRWRSPGPDSRSGGISVRTLT